MNYQTVSTTRSRSEVLNAYMRGVYQWMTIGLLLTAGVAWFVAGNETMVNLIYGNQMLFFGLLIAELVLVFGISAGIRKLSAGAATGLFMLYSALNGATLSFIFLVYTQASIVQAFVVCAAMFGGMSIYGLTTKKDLTSWGSFLFMGLIGIVVASIVNIFLQNSMMHFVISVIGVIVFTGLTAYDTQKLSMMGESMPGDDATAVRRGTILGALTLYLDFINLFLMLLRLFGGSRD